MVGGPAVLARNFAVMTGVNAGLQCAIKKARGGVEDVQGRCASLPAAGTWPGCATLTTLDATPLAARAQHGGVVRSRRRLLAGQRDWRSGAHPQQLLPPRACARKHRVTLTQQPQLSRLLLRQAVLGATAGPAGIVMDAVRTGAVFSLLQGAFYQVGNMMSGKKSPDEDMAFLHTRRMLLALGLQRYEKNFMKGQLDDLTLPLLTDRCGVGRLRSRAAAARILSTQPWHRVLTCTPPPLPLPAR
jgi:hypothetical protein